jgi:hypothetical protein
MEDVRPVASDSFVEARKEMLGLLHIERRTREEADEWLEDMNETHGNRVREFERRLQHLEASHAAGASKEMHELSNTERRLRKGPDEWLEDTNEAHGNRVREFDRRLQSLESLCADLPLSELATYMALQKEMHSSPREEQPTEPRCSPNGSECPAQQDVLQCHSIAADTHKLLMALRASRQNYDQKAQLPPLPMCSGASSTASGGSGRSTPSDPSPRARKESQAEPRSGPQDLECPAQQDLLQRCRGIAADNQKLLRALQASRQNYDRKARLPFLPLCSGASSTISGGSGRSTPSDPSPRANESAGAVQFCA